MTEESQNRPAIAEVIPLARVYGEPVHELPPDLYIPPDALAIFLDHFEGPLDLLLYLIRKHNIDVLDIPMARLTAQYLEYVEMMRSRQFELAAEYLLMAAVLLEIKSRMLLPKPKVVDAEEAGDPRAELVRRLLEYEQMKLAAQKLNALPQIGRDFQIVQAWFEQASRARLQQVNPDDLRQAWMAILARARVHQHHRVTREQLSVRARMTEILRRLQTDRFVEFSDLFGPEGGIAGLVVSFLAILELSRERLVEVTQAAQYGPIYVRIHDPDAEEAA